VKRTAKDDLCDFCDGKVVARTLRVRFHFKGRTIYVDGVPAWVCDHCGEQYLDAQVYKRLEEIAKRRRLIKQTISFPLARYTTAIA
jgi:YgiT-type zinc finger domain-containing protein